MFRRKISSIRAARIVSDLSQSLPPNVTVTVGDINSDRWIVIQGGKEEKLFEIVSAPSYFDSDIFCYILILLFLISG